MGGTPRRAPERTILPFKRAIWSTFWVGGQNPSLDCSWPAPGCFRGRIVREWARVAEKCESEYTSRKRVRNIPSKYEKKGGRTTHSTNCPSKC